MKDTRKMNQKQRLQQITQILARGVLRMRETNLLLTSGCKGSKTSPQRGAQAALRTETSGLTQQIPLTVKSSSGATGE